MEQRPLRTCTLCRSRKIKCDKQQPCANCVRNGSSCTYPAGPGRAPKRPRKAVESRLLAQLARLESVVKRMEGEGEGEGERRGDAQLRGQGQEQGQVDGDAGGVGTVPAQTSQDHLDPSLKREIALEKQIGRLVIDDMQSCYVSSAPWTQLGDEIEELRDLLHQPPSDDEDEVNTPEAVESAGANGAILGYRALAHSLSPYHPPLSQAVALFDIFKANVSPIVRVFHTPTLDRLFWDAVSAIEGVDKNTETLLFAIYYSAVISLEPEQCFNQLGIPRSAALETYRFAVEQAMARANLLTTQNLILLQATVLFLVSLRNEDDSRTVWSLTALVYHIAQAMGLHRDGEAFGLRPLETELRRRLWWHICLLDNRSTDYHGSEPIVHEWIFDTKIPLNVNDADLTADMTAPPAEREGATEMTFCRIRCEAMRVVWKVGYLAPREKHGSTCQRESMKKEVLAKELETRLEENYLKYCDPRVPYLRLAMTVARIITMRMWMAILSPRSKRDRGIRDRLFGESVEVLQHSSSLLTSPDLKRWAWHSRTHVQWYSVAFILAELCWRPPSPECDAAWACVTAVHDTWSAMEGEKKGNLWRPIRRLMARARYVRELQRTKSTQAAGNMQCWRGAGEMMPPNEQPVLLGPLPNAPVVEPQSTIYQETMAPINDPLMELFTPDATGFHDTSMDIFGMLETNGFPGAPGYMPDMGFYASPSSSSHS